MSQDRFKDETYVSWLKLKLSLQYAKEGLEPSTDRKVNTFHGSLKSSILVPPNSSATPTPTCNTCVKVDLQKQWGRQSFSCVAGICDCWLKLLQGHHVSPGERVEWDNVDVSKLPVTPWECAKIYLPYGSDKVQCAGDADLAAILTLHMKCQYFYTSSSSILCEKVKSIRNDLLHSGSMKINTTRMQTEVGVIKALLMDEAFANDQNCKEAISNIDQLLGGKLELSLQGELEWKILCVEMKAVMARSGQLQHTCTTLSQDLTDLTGRVGQNEQLRIEVSDVATQMQTLSGKLVEVQDQIIEIQGVADVLSKFIEASNIEKLDPHQLTDSIGRLSALKAEINIQRQALEEQQQIVCRHELTLNQHELELDQQRQEIDHLKQEHSCKRRRLDSTTPDTCIVAITSCSSQQGQEMTDNVALQKHLVDVYKDDCIWTNPVTRDERVNISQMYARPAINLLRQKDATGRLVEVQQGTSQYKPMLPSYRQVFYTNNNQCQNIYITGDAGMGKTTFCKQLVHTWCKAVHNSAEEGDADDNVSVLKEFRFLFYLKLRDIEKEDYHIEDMIMQYVLHNAPSDIDVSAILKSEKCLVVLDGLDEWSCPQGIRKCRNVNSELPGRNTAIKKCVFITTTRNWKFDVIDLTTNDVDKHVELCGICETSSHELAEKTLKLLNYKSQSKATVVDFFNEVHVKKLASLTNVPVLLVRLLTLWCFCTTGLDKSKVKLFSKMLDLLFEQAKKHLESTVAKHVHKTTELPECFIGQESCNNHTQLILCLSKVAFESLLNKKKELSVVFKSSKLEICGIDESDIALCLQSGILTQSKVFDIETGRLKKFSFLHKKLQEFLAAVHLVTSNDVEGNMRQLRQYCDKLDTTLEMGQMFLFVCGMKADIGEQVLGHLTSVVDDDMRVQKSRQSILPEHLIRSIQTCVTDCVAEGSSNEFTYDVHLQDYWIDVITISHYNECVVRKEVHTIKSVYIDTAHCNSELVNTVLNHLQEVHTLEKLWLRCPHRGADSLLAKIVSNNAKTLTSLLFEVNHTLSGVLVNAVLSCIPSLVNLGLAMLHEKGQLLKMVKEQGWGKKYGQFVEMVLEPILEQDHIQRMSDIINQVPGQLSGLEQDEERVKRMLNYVMEQFGQLLQQKYGLVQGYLLGQMLSQHTPSLEGKQEQELVSLQGPKQVRPEFKYPLRQFNEQFEALAQSSSQKDPPNQRLQQETLNVEHIHEHGIGYGQEHLMGRQPEQRLEHTPAHGWEQIPEQQRHKKAMKQIPDHGLGQRSEQGQGQKPEQEPEQMSEQGQEQRPAQRQGQEPEQGQGQLPGQGKEQVLLQRQMQVSKQKQSRSADQEQGNLPKPEHSQRFDQGQEQKQNQGQEQRSAQGQGQLSEQGQEQLSEQGQDQRPEQRHAQMSNQGYGQWPDQGQEQGSASSHEQEQILELAFGGVMRVLKQRPNQGSLQGLGWIVEKSLELGLHKMLEEVAPLFEHLFLSGWGQWSNDGHMQGLGLLTEPIQLTCQTLMYGSTEIMVFDFSGPNLTHSQIEQLLSALPKQCRQLQLELYCTDHEGGCRPEIDLSDHTQLQTIKLRRLHVTNLYVVSHGAEEVLLYDVAIACSTLRQFIDTIPETSNKLQEVCLSNVTIQQDVHVPEDLEAYLRHCDKFTVERCEVWSNNNWLIRLKCKK